MTEIQELTNEIRKLNVLLSAFMGNGMLPVVPHTAISLVEWLYEWLEKYKAERQSAKTLKNNVAFVKNYIIPYFGDKELHEITGEDCQDFFKGIAQTNTRDKIKLLLNGGYKKAVALRKVQYNPLDTVEFKRHKSESYPTFQPNEQLRVLRAMDGSKYKPLFMFLCCTGMRVSEALSVRGCDIDTRAKVIRIPLEDTSTKKHKREVPYVPELFAGLEIKHNELLFPFSYNGFGDYFRAIVERLKLPHVIHSTRHTFISVGNYVGIPFKHLQMWVGHKTLAMTTDTYTDIIKGRDTPIITYLRQLKKLHKIR